LGHEARQDDLTLVRLAADGRQEAFDTLVRRHQDRVYGTIHRMVNDREKAMDLTQETFLRAWKGIGAFHGDSSFFTWLYRIARNVIISRSRYDAARPKLNVSLDSHEDGEPRAAPEPVEAGSSPEDSIVQAEQRRLVLEAIAAMPPDFKEVLVLRDMQDESYETIADLLDIPVGTVRSRLHRARLELKQVLRSRVGPTD